jgi:polyferredoxin
MAGLQRSRRALQLSFFALFLLAPALDVLRFDITEPQLWFMGFRWNLGIEPFLRGEETATQAAWSIIWRAIVPGVVLVVGFMTLAYRYGRLYCGWMCPHFSMVETLNGLLHRACGKFSVWETQTTPRAGRVPHRAWWLAYVGLGVLVGLLWAVTLLTYLLPPAQVWSNLVAGTLTPNQARFIVIGGLVFAAEMLLARHLFCRFGCAVGLFQSVAWMANDKGLVMAYDRARAADCRACRTDNAPEGAACDAVCPMRLKPRNIKRLMFTCVQCGQCLAECEQSNATRQRSPNLEWKVGLDAVRETLRQRRGE